MSRVVDRAARPRRPGARRPHGLARAVGHAARRDPGRPRAAPVPAPRARLGRALPRVRPRRAGLGAVPVAEDARRELGPARGVDRRGRRRLPLPHPRDRVLWGRPAWGVWWTWDARLTSTALLDILFIGYLALRRVPADPHVRARRCAVLALLAALDVPIVHFSVQWWNGLHQGASVLDGGLPLPRSTARCSGRCCSASSRCRRSSRGWCGAATRSPCARRPTEDAELAEALSRAPGRGGPMSYVAWGYVVTLGVLGGVRDVPVVRSRRR